MVITFVGGLIHVYAIGYRQVRNYLGMGSAIAVRNQAIVARTSL